MIEAPDHLDVFWINRDGAVCSAWWNGFANNGAWNPPFTISPPNMAHILSGIACVSRVREHIMFFGSAQTVRYEPPGGVLL